MSLILAKTKFKGPLDEAHTLYRPFTNERSFHDRPLTPYLPADEDEAYVNAEAAEAGGVDVDAPAAEEEEAMPPPPPQPEHAQWAPPAGYFDPYFASMRQNLEQGFSSQFQAYGQQMNTSFQTMQQNLQEHMSSQFTQFGQHLQENVYTPLMDRMNAMNNSIANDMDALKERFDGLTTQEDHQELVERQGNLQQDFDAFRDHFHTYFPAPPPPPQFFPHQPYFHDPQPPPEFYQPPPEFYQPPPPPPEF